MRLLVAAAILSVLAACESKEEQAKQGSSDAQEAKKSQGTEVEIKPEIQQRIGLKLLKVETRSVPVAFTAPGQIVLNEERTVRVGSYADGRVVELSANIGAHVQRGAVLARLHSHAVHETRAAFDSARQEVRRQEQMVAYREGLRDRVARLLQLKSASAQELERAESDLRSAQTDLQNARINEQKESAHLADILRIPEPELKNIDEHSELAPILAPVAGVVIDRKITLGTIVEPGQETFTLSDLASVWMIASVSEADLASLRIGSAAKVRSQAYPDEAFEGNVTFIAPEMDPQTRTLQARILLPNRGRKLHPGMFANAEITEGPSRRSIFIPEQAIQDLNGGSVTFVRKDENKFEPHPIKIAHRLNGEAEISAGLKEGDTIVTDGSFVVKSELLKSQVGQ